MAYSIVFRAHWDSSEVCCLCARFLSGHIAVRTTSRVAHYKCAKKHHWKRLSRAKKITKKPVEVKPKAIKVVRGGKIIKTIKQP